jgi:hypothetical protein
MLPPVFAALTPSLFHAEFHAALAPVDDSVITTRTVEELREKVVAVGGVAADDSF